MIVDTSVVVALLRNEPDAEKLAAILERADAPKMSVASYIEAGAVVDAARDPVLSRAMDELIRIAGIEIRPVTVAQGYLARAAYRDFGRGSGHPARLNFADCFVYALAKETGEPVLFQGSDFSRTDLESA